MKNRVIDLWIRTQESYWFIPGLLSAGALIAALLLVRIDYAIGESWLTAVPWLRINQAESAQAILSTVAGSTITVAGVTFSMTLLAVSHATSQIGAHLLSGFMRDRGNQVTLGVFIATFIYCLTVLRSIHAADTGTASTAEDFVPQIALNGGLLLSALSVMVLIYFINHVPQSINITNIVARVGDNLISCIATLYPENLGATAPADQAKDARSVHSSEPVIIANPPPGGYLRMIDDSTLLTLAAECELLIEIRKRPGDFCLPGEELLHVWSGDELAEEVETKLLACFTWGNERNQSQDVLFPVQQLMEILGRALSPGVNNQYTALLCINQLSRAILEMLTRQVPAQQRLDVSGEVRIIAAAVDHEQFIDAVIGPLRQYASSDGIARAHALDLLQRLDQLIDQQETDSLVKRAIARFRQPD